MSIILHSSYFEILPNLKVEIRIMPNVPADIRTVEKNYLGTPLFENNKDKIDCSLETKDFYNFPGGGLEPQKMVATVLKV